MQKIAALAWYLDIWRKIQASIKSTWDWRYVYTYEITTIVNHTAIKWF